MDEFVEVTQANPKAKLATQKGTTNETRKEVGWREPQFVW